MYIFVVLIKVIVTVFMICMAILMFPVFKKNLADIKEDQEGIITFAESTIMIMAGLAFVTMTAAVLVILWMA